MDKKFTQTEEKVSSEVVKETTAMIAKQLNEPAVERLRWIVAYLGPKVALEVLQHTLEIEEQGGMLIQNGSRRRTPGGLFFYLVKQGVDKKDRRKLFPYTPSNQSKLWPKRRARTGRSSKNDSIWQKREAKRAEYGSALKELLKNQQFGMAETMSVKLVGRPGQVVQQDSFVITIMKLSPQLASLSKDLPPMPQTDLRLLVYITKKQWDEVAPSLQQPENSLNISGILTYDDILRRMILFARAVTVKIGVPAVSEQAETSSEGKQQADDKPIEPSEVQQAGLALLEMEASEEQKSLSLEEEFKEDELDEHALHHPAWSEEELDAKLDLERG